MSRLILDFDASVRGIADAQRVDCRAWEEAIRFGCGRNTWRRFSEFLQGRLPAEHGPVLFGSGDLHHLSALLVKRCPAQSLEVVVFDNHPDNMRFPFGIHCGSWVKDVSRLPNVAAIHVVGICSADVGVAHAWENNLGPLVSGRVSYWTVGVDTRWARWVGLQRQFRSFRSSADLIDAFSTHLFGTRAPIYLSIDKDVLSPEEARTNWDQGCMQLGEIAEAITHMRGRIVGSDITGEISIAHYGTRWKRWLSGLDAQPEIDGRMLLEWQEQQAMVNRSLLAAIDAAL